MIKDVNEEMVSVRKNPGQLSEIPSLNTIDEEIDMKLEKHSSRRRYKKNTLQD
jgi:hypothetical protein